MPRTLRPVFTVPALAAALACLAMLSPGCGAANPRARSQPVASQSIPTAPTTGPRQPGDAGASHDTTAPASGANASARRPPAKVPPAHPVPPSFQPAPGALSDAQVAAELAQLSAVQRREYESRLSAAAASLAGLLPWSLEPKSGVQVSVASVFYDYGLGLACGGVLGRTQLGVAHKTAPCGTLITFTYAGRSITVPVIDRGPYVAGREWDLTGATAAALRFPGLGQIEWSLAS
jgi:hypothetical protein